MKAGAVVDVNENLLKFTEHLVSISEFSKGKTSKIFDDISKFRYNDSGDRNDNK